MRCPSTTTSKGLEILPKLSEVEGRLPTQTGTLDGSFSVINWEGYPTNIPKPKGPFRLLQGEEYTAARSAANNANAKLRYDLELNKTGVDIHEVVPVKLGGNPTRLSNKIFIQRSPTHVQLTEFWKREEC